MKIAVFGTGSVGETLGSKLLELGHEVMMGSRTGNNEKAAAWVKKAGAKASTGTFTDAAKFGELIINATLGAGTVEAFKMAGDGNCSGKTVLDLSNPRQLPDSHHTFVAGNDEGAKTQVKTLLAAFGWKPEEVIDVGDLTGARATEQYLPLWARLYGALKVGNFNIKIVR